MELNIFSPWKNKRCENPRVSISKYRDTRKVKEELRIRTWGSGLTRYTFVQCQDPLGPSPCNDKHSWRPQGNPNIWMWTLVWKNPSNLRLLVNLGVSVSSFDPHHAVSMLWGSESKSLWSLFSSLILSAPGSQGQSAPCCCYCLLVPPTSLIAWNHLEFSVVIYIFFCF